MSESERVSIPKGATHVDMRRGGTGTFYKRGSHGFIFYYDRKFKEWKRSHRINELSGLDEIVFYEYDQD